MTTTTPNDPYEIFADLLKHADDAALYDLANQIAQIHTGRLETIASEEMEIRRAKAYAIRLKGAA